MKDQVHNLITNTTSLVGYIAVLMFVGAYLGGDNSYMFDPAFLKGSVLESSSALYPVSIERGQGVVITINGRQYQATIQKDLGNSTPVFTY